MSRGKTVTKPWSGWGSMWGEYSATTELPNVSDATTQDSNLNEGDTAWVSGALYVCTDASEGGATWAAVLHDGGIGKSQQLVGPFTAPGSAGVLAADQSNLDCRYSHPVSAAALGFVAMRTGSITGISAQVSAAITGTGEEVVVSVTKNGTEVECSATFTQSGAETEVHDTVDKGTLTFAAGDIIGVSYTSGTITNTPAMVATVEIES